MDDLVTEFISETAEGLSELDTQLIELEQNPNDAEIIGGIFRIVHTIKGTCGFLGLPRLERIAHAAENVLGRFRDKELEPSAASVTLILRTLDCLKDVLAALEETGVEPEADDSALIDDLNAMANSDGAGPASEVAFSNDDDVFDAGTPSSEGDDDVLDLGAPSAEANDETLDLGAPSVEEDGDTLDLGAPSVEDDEMLDLGAPSVEDASPAPKAVASPTPKPAASASKQPAAKAAPAPKASSGRDIAASAQNIRVSVNLLEDLMTMVSELVLTRNQLLQTLRQQDDSAFATPLQRLNHITSEIQEGVMKTRMQPIGNAWNKLPRIVRDLAQELDKKIELDMIGAETELDRQILELIKDPLTHMVRNSCDHGLETTADRRLAGKPDEGRITLHAFHEGGHIIIRISDDGKGLPVAKIKEKVVANGIATEGELEMMSHQEIIQMIFKPGFSTAQAVTNVSGRGVGMDVVRTNIEKIGGAIELDSQEGAGSTFTIKIPLTLAIVAALIVESSGERFAIPQISVLELVRASARSEHRIEIIDNASVLRLRDQLLPLAHLGGLLGLTESTLLPENDHFVVVSQVGPHMFGIVVDRVFDTEEIVVKPVTPILRENPVFSGNTVLGDGSVVMILDPNGLASNMGASHSSESASRRHDKAKTSQDGETAALLTFKAGAGAPKAVPLSLVARLE
ncbi:MAG: chemotaxis protein CheA [Alphaproteobacteria bacterium]